MSELPQPQALIEPHVLNRLSKALLEDRPWPRVDRLLEALIGLRGDEPCAIAQSSLWHLPEKDPGQMQRIRGRYLTRPADYDWDDTLVQRLFSTNMVEWAELGVKALHRRIDDAPDHLLLADYRSICTPRVWRSTLIYQRAAKPLGFENGLACYWRINPEQCINISLWVCQQEDFPTDHQRRQGAAIFMLAKPLVERVFVHDRVAKHIDALTGRQKDVLRLVLAGSSEKEMARKLHRSAHTVHSHIREIYRQFAVQSRAELMARFIDQAAVSPPNEDGWA